jgi:murein DD-endopeptidase MepM/ murein hydrolase activator NlpD
LGNSGNTTGPHLHFQLMTRPSLLVADGLPFELSQFRIDGHVPSLDAMTRATEAGTPIPVDRSGAGDHQDQGLLGLEVLTFPG